MSDRLVTELSHAASASVAASPVVAMRPRQVRDGGSGGDADRPRGVPDQADAEAAAGGTDADTPYAESPAPLEPELPSLGAAVRGAREAAGMTLAQVGDRTKIRLAVLQDLEQGRTERAGGAAYARGHLRAVARVTGADPAVLLAAHDREAGEAPPLPLAPPPRPPARRAGRPAPALPPRHVPVRADTGALGLPTAAHERGGPRWGLLGGAAALVLAVLLLVGRLTGGGPSTVTPSAGPGTGPSAPAVAAAPAPPPAAAALRLRVSGTPSWVSVLTSTGTSLFTGVLAAGAAREFSDPSRLQVVVGNAGAVTVGCAGQDVAAGTKGQVRRYTCAPTGLTPS